MTDPKFHCQICAREIHAKTGLIAHHGYRRPDRGSGWQTASCFGARWHPYEVACDALPPAIARAKQHLTAVTGALETLRNSPPEIYTIQRRDAWGTPRGLPILVTRPEGFDGTGKSPGSWTHRSYESQFWPLHRQLTEDIRDTGADISFLERRLAEWRAPV